MPVRPLAALSVVFVAVTLILPAARVRGWQEPPVASGTWTALAHAPSAPLALCLLLFDGTVMCQQLQSNNWFKLTADNAGSYVNGTWSSLASMASNYQPLYYASAVLPDGRVIVEGGEYNVSGNRVTLGAIYDPSTNVWTAVSPPSGWTTIGDATSVVLANGTFMLQNCCSGQAALLNASNLTWTATGTGKANNYNDEEGWTLLPDGSVLTVDAFPTGTLNAERYLPSTGGWINAGTLPAAIADNATSGNSFEVGPCVLRATGTVFCVGATGNTTVYTPPVTLNGTGSWVSGPQLPIQSGTARWAAADAPAALLPNGNVLAMVSPGVYVSPSAWFEYDGSSWTQVNSTASAAFDRSYFGSMLLLPTGQVLQTDLSTGVYIYTPSGNANPAWAPTITSAPSFIVPGVSYPIAGTQFNGLSQGSMYGDENQAATNYPIVRITNRATGHVFYARTHDRSTMGVATGSAIVSTTFDVPASIEAGASDIEVVANGVSSGKTAITCTFTPVFTDDPLRAGVTPLKVIHVAELRALIAALRARSGLGVVTWTDPTLLAGTTPVKAAHLTEMRTALAAVYVAAGRTPPTYTHPILSAGTSTITALDLMELRAAILAIY